MSDIESKKERILIQLKQIENQFTKKTPKEDRADLEKMRSIVTSDDPKEMKRLLDELMDSSMPEFRVLLGSFPTLSTMMQPAMESENFILTALDILLTRLELK